MKRKKKLTKKDLLKNEIKHADITKIDGLQKINMQRDMGFSARSTAEAADIIEEAVEDETCTNILTIAGSTQPAGCMQVYPDMVKYNMVDVIVAIGAAIIDMDLLEALGFKHYKGDVNMDDELLRSLYIDRIYDTYIDEDDLQKVDMTIKGIADSLEPRPYSSREFIQEIGKWLTINSVKKESLIQTAYENNVPIFCPAFNDCSAGFGLVKHQIERIKAGKPYVTIDSMADFRELTEIKIAAKTTGVFMVGGGVPKNFTLDIVVCAEVAFEKEVEMHKYTVQVSVADERDGALSGSTLKEAGSWGKVEKGKQKMVFAEATLVIPDIVSYVYHKRAWETRKRRNWAILFKKPAKFRYRNH